MADYVSAGFDPEQFWRITLREYIAHMTGAGKRLEREQSNRAWSAHTTAMLGRVDGKKFPKLEDMLNPKPKTKKTPMQMQQIAACWDAAINGMQH